MLADFFTKPLQCTLFRKMRDVMMGIQPITILKTEDELIQENETRESISGASSEIESTSTDSPSSSRRRSYRPPP